MRANHNHHHNHNAAAANANVNNNQPPPTATTSTGGYFSGAPVTKFLAMIMVFLFVVLHSYSNKRNGNNNLYQWFMMTSSNNTTTESSSLFLWMFVRSLLRRLVSNLTFSTTGEMVTGGLLWAYWSRKFEREMGSTKYSIFVVWILVFSGLLGETIRWWHTQQQQRGESLPGAPTNYRVRPGPYPLLGALAWLYHWFTPRIYPRFMGVLGLYFSEKSFVYMWFAQVMLSASGSGGGLFGGQSHSSGRMSALTVILTGFLASMIFTQWNSLFSKLVDHIPRPLVAALSQLSQRVLMETPPRILVPNHFGARGGGGGNVGGGGGGGRNNMAAANAAGMAGAGATVAAAAARHFHEAELAAAMAASRLQAQPTLQQQQQAQAAQPPPPPPPPDPAAVEQLVMMGFDRAQVVQALQSCNNDVQRAADRLLTQAGVM